MSTEIESWRKQVRDTCREWGVPHADSIERYVIDGVPTGGFLAAVLANDFMEAAGRADSTNSRLLREWAGVLYNGVPADCKGSHEAVANWIARGGLRAILSETPNAL